ncbi:hypothetical protein CLV68_2844 [Actinokineospora cianjurensis]|uniref:Uncharacterized protein n=2 Tax=Actinokineospora cianjurensis TaxID=585224 RepID=A0A421BD72_9PSEU|nr:hypothetical protein CLV68_2844 [Actinokineospora cianjurensis]
MSPVGWHPPAPREPLWWPGLVAALLMLAAAALAVVGSLLRLLGGSFWDDEFAGQDEPAFNPLEATVWSSIDDRVDRSMGLFTVTPPGSWLPVLVAVVLAVVVAGYGVVAAVRPSGFTATMTRVTAALTAGILLSAAFLVLQSILRIKAEVDYMNRMVDEAQPDLPITDGRIPMPELWVGPGSVVLGIAALVAVVGMAFTWLPRRTPWAPPVFAPPVPGPPPWVPAGAAQAPAPAPAEQTTEEPRPGA